MEEIRITKENLFTRFKPSSKAEVLFKNGDVITITSEPVLEMIRKGKILIVKNDVDGFRDLMGSSGRKALSRNDRKLLLNTSMVDGTEYGYTVSEILEDIYTIEECGFI